MIRRLRIRPRPHPFAAICLVVLAAQLAGFLVYSSYLYGHFDLLEDFAHNAQAWFLIGHGHWSPLDTVRIPSTPFVRDHLDLIMWPLSLLHFLWDSPFWLLVAQDLAVVTAEAVTLYWIWLLLVQHLDRHRTAAGVLALVVLVANAWWYETVSFDVHLTPLGLPMLVLTGYWLWRGRWGRASLAAAACLLFGAVVTELLVFVGLGGLLVILLRRHRDRRGVVVAVAVAVLAGLWVVTVTGLGANQASNLASQYSYLVNGDGHAGTLALLGGVLRHPLRAGHMLARRAHAMLRPLVTAGVVGVASPVGLLVAVGSLVPAGLALSPSFSSVNDSFQTLAVIPFVLVGSVMVLLWLGRRFRPRRRGQKGIVWALACLLALTAVVQDARLLIHLRQTWWTVTPSAAAALRRGLDHTPPSAEVIASNGVIGRFSQRRFVYPLQLSPQAFPVHSADVVLVIATAGNEALARPQIDADVRFARHRLHARIVSRGAGATVLRWHAPTAKHRIVFP